MLDVGVAQEIDDDLLVSLEMDQHLPAALGARQVAIGIAQGLDGERLLNDASAAKKPAKKPLPKPGREN